MVVLLGKTDMSLHEYGICEHNSSRIDSNMSACVLRGAMYP